MVTKLVVGKTGFGVVGVKSFIDCLAEKLEKEYVAGENPLVKFCVPYHNWRDVLAALKEWNVAVEAQQGEAE